MTSINWFTVLRGYRNEISPEDMGKYVLGTYHRESKKHTAQIPVPIREILTWLRIELKEVDYKMAQSSNSDPTGLIPVITVGSYYTEEEKRFLISHQLGHLLLHEKKPHDIESYVKENDDRNLFKKLFFKKPVTEDDEANEFAGSLLMPSNWVIGDVYSYEVNINKFARKYQVTKTAMEWRLRCSLKVY